MNILEWRVKLLGAPYRGGDPSGGGGAQAERDDAAAVDAAAGTTGTGGFNGSWGGGGAQAERDDAAAVDAAAGTTGTGGYSGTWDGDGSLGGGGSADNEINPYDPGSYFESGGFASTSQATTVSAPPSSATEEKQEAEAEDKTEQESVAQSVAKGLLGTIETNPSKSSPYGVDGKPSNALQAIGNLFDSAKSNLTNAVPDDSRVLSTFVDPAQAAQMKELGLTPPSRSAQDFVNSYADPSKSAAANGGSLPGYSTNGIALKDLQALDQSGYGKFDVSPTQTVSQARGVMDVVDPALQTGVKVLEMTTPLGTMKSVAQAIDRAKKTGDYIGEAGRFVGGWATQKAVGAVNNAVLGQLGDVGKVIGDVNRGAALARAFGADVPGINPVGMIGSAIGIGGGNQNISSTTLPDGTTPFAPSGSERGGGGSSQPAPITQPIQTTTTEPTSTGLINYGQRFNGAALGKAIREGAANRYRR